MIGLVPKSTQAEMNEAVENAKETFKTWSKTTILQRQQIMFRYQDLIKKNMVRVPFDLFSSRSDLLFAAL